MIGHARYFDRNPAVLDAHVGLPASARGQRHRTNGLNISRRIGDPAAETTIINLPCPLVIRGSTANTVIG